MTRGAHRDLSWFYSQWFDRPGAPDWQVETVDSARIRRRAIRQRSAPYRLSVRINVTSERCGRKTVRIVLRDVVTLLPTPAARCGNGSPVVDPAYEILHGPPAAKGVQHGRGVSVLPDRRSKRLERQTEVDPAGHVRGRTDKGVDRPGLDLAA